MECEDLVLRMYFEHTYSFLSPKVELQNTEKVMQLEDAQIDTLRCQYPAGKDDHRTTENLFNFWVST